MQPSLTEALQSLSASIEASEPRKSGGHSKEWYVYWLAAKTNQNSKLLAIGKVKEWTDEGSAPGDCPYCGLPLLLIAGIRLFDCQWGPFAKNIGRQYAFHTGDFKLNDTVLWASPHPEDNCLERWKEENYDQTKD